MPAAEQIRSDTTTAMKSGDRDRVRTLRMLTAELQRDAKEGAADEQAVLRRERKRRRESEATFRDAGRTDLAETEAYEAGVIEDYLPAELDDAQIAAIATDAVASSGAQGPQDMGQAMKAAMAVVAGRADGKRVQAAVREALSA